MPQERRVQELAYWVKVQDVMRRDVITVAPDTSMRQFGEVLREGRITGVPVVADGQAVGIISIEELIDWLVDGGADQAVQARMSPNVISVFADEPVVNAVGKLAHYGFGRLPVLDRPTGALVGVVTKGILVSGLLAKLEADRAEVALPVPASGGEIFGRIAADTARLVFAYHVEGRDLEHAGDVASRIKKTLKGLVLPGAICRRAAIAAYEAEMNLILYTPGGDVEVVVDSDELYMRVYDSGPGILDVKKAMREGYSTAPHWVRELGFGAGMGLSNIGRCADRMTIESAAGKGTSLDIHIALVQT